MFLAGGKVKPGLDGEHPSLTELSQGDLQHHTDFRAVYATILESWFGYNSRNIVGGDFNPLALIES